MTLLDLGLHLEGVPQDTINDLDAHLPHIQRLAAAFKQAEPIITQLMPIFQKAWPDIIAVTPLASKLITFVKQKES